MDATKVNPLEVLGRRYGTDKISTHGYHVFYHDALKHLRDTKFNMMEIGVADFRSVDMWKVYFPFAKVYGIDIGKEYSDERVTIFKGDQSNQADLLNIIGKMNTKCDFINDDGSHIPEHQLLTFDLFFSQLLNDGGIYIIEDVEVSYWKRGGLYGYPTAYGYGHPSSIVEKFKIIIDFLNGRYLGASDYETVVRKLGGISLNTLMSISSITFGQNCIIVKKKNPTDYNFTSRNTPYTFGSFTV